MFKVEFNEDGTIKLSALLEEEKRMKLEEQRREGFYAPKEMIISGEKKMVWHNPNIKNKDYLCYWDGEDGENDLEVHKDIAEKQIFSKYPDFFAKQYPGKTFSELVVHHIDKDKDNFEAKNLVIVSYEQHGTWKRSRKKISHKKIIKGDRSSGLQELRRLGIKSPHLEELSPNPN